MSIKSWYLIHKWTSLICTLFLLMLCVTGLPLIFHHEIDQALGYTVALPQEVEVAGPADVDRILEDARSRRPGEVVQFLVRDPEEPDALFVRMGTRPESGAISAYMTYDARTGEYLHQYPLEEGVMNFLLRLHVDMFAGLPGTLFLGFMGLLLVASLVSGVVVYGPYMSKLPFGTVRRERSPRLKWLDLHNLLGIATLMWLLVVGVTGVVNTLSVPIFGQWQATELADMTEPYRELPPLEDPGSGAAALAAVRAAEPDMELSFLAFPGNEFASPHHYVAFMQGTTPWRSKLLKPVLVDARTSEVIDARELPWYVHTLLVSQPLHFGDYGGLPLKILWAVMDALAIVVLASGVYLWLKKRHLSVEARLGLSEKETRSQRRSPGGRRRLTSAQVWSVPILLGILSTIGLVAALLADGFWDRVSWLALGVPVAVCGWCIWFRGSRKGIHRGRPSTQATRPEEEYP